MATSAPRITTAIATKSTQVSKTSPSAQSSFSQFASAVSVNVFLLGGTKGLS